MNNNNLPPWQQNISLNQYLPQTNENPSGAPVKEVTEVPEILIPENNDTDTER